MKFRTIANARVLSFGDDSILRTIHINTEGRIQAVEVYQETDILGEGAFDAEGQIVLPGFIDVQVNGGGGVLFNDHPTVDGIVAIGAAHRQFGTTGYLPTLISDDPQKMRAAIKAVDSAIEAGIPGVLGIHLEGPYLNATKRGVHDSEKFSRIGPDEIALLCSLKHGKTLVTLAPELTTPDVIRTLTNRGVIVSAGHTLGTYDDGMSAIEAGLRGFTHLFNAMTPLASREPGIAAAAINDKRAWCGVIADGHHVHPAMLQMAFRAKAGRNIFLVTDAMPSVGAAHKDFSLDGQPITVTDGRCLTREGTLAGSDLDMMCAVRNAQAFFDISFSQAAELASIVPAQFLGLDNNYGSISVGQWANINLIDDNMSVTKSWIKGVTG
ncbi:N-acetylglucosamine-6-phosphate deacetylase [Fretibacter rubidus]|uniref:N-acetylglucosamine-6-phosphate deacetylase n=1 Tax=Fretibacter rubidus TaxID=570162 RepID=UPI00352B1BF0